VPAALAVTFSETVQEALFATVPPVSKIVPLPAIAVAVPPHVLVRPLGVFTTSPAGRLSVKATPLSGGAVFGLLIVKVSEAVPLAFMDAGPNALLIVGGNGGAAKAVAGNPMAAIATTSHANGERRRMTAVLGANPGAQ
jgi:hypothetical protein